MYLSGVAKEGGGPGYLPLKLWPIIGLQGMQVIHTIKPQLVYTHINSYKAIHAHVHVHVHVCAINMYSVYM